jgi:hypothetical protein
MPLSSRLAPVGVAIKTAVACSSSLPNLLVTKLPALSFNIASFSVLKLVEANSQRRNEL